MRGMVKRECLTKAMGQSWISATAYLCVPTPVKHMCGCVWCWGEGGGGVNEIRNA